MKQKQIEKILSFDQKHIWHPYTSMIHPLVYNRHIKTDSIITEDSMKIISGYLKSSGFGCSIVPIDRIDPDNPGLVDFSAFFD